MEKDVHRDKEPANNVSESEDEDFEVEEWKCVSIAASTASPDSGSVMERGRAESMNICGGPTWKLRGMKWLGWTTALELSVPTSPCAKTCSNLRRKED
jgi:hypothetical protein